MDKEEIIKITTNGFWLSNDCLYLDEYEYKTDKEITFDEFERNYDYYDLKTKWGGNNPFTRDECLRFWISENARVEICVFNNRPTKISIYKVIDIKGYKETSKLMIDLIRIEELYKYLMKQFEEYKEVYIVGENNE